MIADGRLRRMSVEERFWGKVAIAGPDDCWEWLATRGEWGYGYFGLSIPGRPRTVTAHRFAWELVHGYPPGDLHVLHECDNPPCVNPRHLWLGTNLMNNADMVAKERQRGAVGVQNQGAVLTEAIVQEIRARYAAGGIVQHDLARAYGITQGAVSKIIRRATWSHVA